MPDIGYGVTLSVSDAAPATSPVNAIGTIMSFTPPNPSRDIIDVTSSSSANMNREFIAGLVDQGEAAFEMLWDTGSAADVLLRGISAERLPRTYRATFSQYSPARTITFAAFLTGYERSAPLEDKMTATVSLKVTGTVTYA